MRTKEPLFIQQLFPCSFERGSKPLVYLGVISALVYTYSTIWYRGEFDNLPGNLMVLTFLISAWQQRHHLKTDLMILFLLLSILLPLALFIANASIDYELAYKYKSLNDFSKLFYFLPLAWWLGGSIKAAYSMYLLAFLGLLTAVLIDPQLVQTLNAVFEGQRVNFGIHNWQHDAMLFGLVFLFSLTKLFTLNRDSTNIFKFTLLSFACLFAAFGLFATQTRAAYLGLLVCMMVFLLSSIRNRISITWSFKSTIKTLAVTIVSIALISGVVTQLQKGRFVRENVDIQHLFEGKTDRLKMNSIGIRIHSWLESLDWIAERPVIGWGRTARIDVIKSSDRFPDHIKDRIGHLHNGYLELLLGYGIIGFVFLFSLLYLLLMRIKSSSNGQLLAFTYFATIYFLVLNMFESFFFYWSGIFAFSIIMAGGYSQYLSVQLSKKSSDRLA